MNKRRLLSLTMFGVAFFILLVFSFMFVNKYVSYGIDSGRDTLFALLTKINYVYLVPAFMSVLLCMFLLDTLVILTRYFWREYRSKMTLPFRWNASAYWHKYQTVHLTFILLTIFLTIAIIGPAKIMNTFTAIVSISVLVSNLTKS